MKLLVDAEKLVVGGGDFLPAVSKLEGVKGQLAALFRQGLARCRPVFGFKLNDPFRDTLKARRGVKAIIVAALSVRVDRKRDLQRHTAVVRHQPAEIRC